MFYSDRLLRSYLWVALSMWEGGPILHLKCMHAKVFAVWEERACLVVGCISPEQLDTEINIKADEIEEQGGFLCFNIP